MFLFESKSTLFGLPKVDAFRNHLGGTMLFRVFRVAYTVKESCSHFGTVDRIVTF